MSSTLGSQTRISVTVYPAFSAWPDAVPLVPVLPPTCLDSSDLFRASHIVHVRHGPTLEVTRHARSQGGLHALASSFGRTGYCPCGIVARDCWGSGHQWTKLLGQPSGLH